MNDEILSLIKHDCYVVYLYKDARFLSHIIHTDSPYDMNLQAEDLFILSNKEHHDLAGAWEICRVIKSGGVIITEFYPNKETMRKAYAEYFI